MLPDFAAPPFAFVALCTVRFREREDGSPRRIRSDYRCQARKTQEAASYIEVRVYLVGSECAESGEEVPAILAFLDWEAQRVDWRVGSQFELCEGRAVTAVGTVQSLATRSAA